MMPDEPARVWEIVLPMDTSLPGEFVLVVGVPNPVPHAPPLRFANETQDQYLPGWLTLGTVAK